MRILVVEDDAVLAHGIRKVLDPFGFQLTLAASGAAAERAIAADTFDLALLDLGLPDADGLALLRTLRTDHRRLHVIVITARDSIDDRIRGLDLGADDYLVKPVTLAELAARVRAVARRLRIEGSSRLVHGPIVMDTDAKRAWIDDTPIELTVREWRMLEYLLRRPGRVVSKEQMLGVVSGREDAVSYNAVEVYMSRLRAKLDPAGVRVRTVRGFGYMLEEDRTDDPAP